MRHGIALAGAAALLLCAAPETRAEAGRLRVTIPFPFAAAGHVLPAGEYVFEHQAHRSLLVITTPAGRRVALLTLPGAPSCQTDRTELVFRKADAGWQLTAIALAGSSHGATVPARPRAEAIRGGARRGGGPPPVRVAVDARRAACAMPARRAHRPRGIALCFSIQ